MSSGPYRAEQKTLVSIMTLHNEMCEGCEVTSAKGGPDVERMTVRSDVVMQTDQRKNDHCHGQSVQDQVDERRR